MDTTAMAPSPDMSKYRVPGSDACYYIPDFLTVEEEEYLIRKIQEYPPQRWKQLSNHCSFGVNIASHRISGSDTTAHFFWSTGGELTSKNVLVAQPLPSFVDTYPDIIGRLQETGVFAKSPHGKPNHIIMNEYLPGQGIMPHQDGPAYFPVVATLSLGSHTMFHYYRYEDAEEDGAASEPKTPGTGRSIDPSPVLSLLLEPRSLVISERALYTDHLHAIREVKEDLIAASEGTNPPSVADLRVPIANWDRVTGADVIKAMSEGGKLQRATRYSLTCRNVEKVAQLKAFMKR